jgi:hypothetical protein
MRILSFLFFLLAIAGCKQSKQKNISEPAKGNKLSFTGTTWKKEWIITKIGDQKNISQFTIGNKLSFVSPKWKNELIITEIQYQQDLVTGYLLGNDTYPADMTSNIDSTFKYIRNRSLQLFIQSFCDTANEKPVYPFLIKREKIDSLITNKLFRANTHKWFMADSLNFISQLVIQQINLDDDPAKEIVIEIIRDNHWEHVYRLYKKNGLKYISIGETWAINRNFWPAPIKKMPGWPYWAVTSFGWGTGYGAGCLSFYKIQNNYIIQMSDPITEFNYHSLYFFSESDYGAIAEINSEFNFIDKTNLKISYYYTLKFFSDTTEIILLNKVKHISYYSCNNAINRFITNDIYITRGDSIYDGEIELTPAFANKLEKMRVSGTARQRKLLKGFKKEDWLIDYDRTCNPNSSSID